MTKKKGTRQSGDQKKRALVRTQRINADSEWFQIRRELVPHFFPKNLDTEVDTLSDLIQILIRINNKHNRSTFCLLEREKKVG